MSLRSHIARIHRPVMRVATATVIACATVTLTAAIAPSCETQSAPTESLGTVDRRLGADLAIDWSQTAYDIAYAEDQFLTFKGQRAIAMMHLAMHDALQAIDPVYHAFAYRAESPSADPIAAATTAAHEVLSASYPSAKARLDSLRDAWLGRAGESSARDRGMKLGSAAAQAIIELRTGDGYDTPGSYEFGNGPGRYQTTPPHDGFVVQPGFGLARPFSFDDPTRFRPKPPPPLGSPDYASAFDEVRRQGDSSSTTRTADQTGYAVWWMEFAESSVGRLMRRLLEERDLDLWAANRALAHMYMALFDGYVVTWNAKYEYDHWRPYTAIRSAAGDGNPATDADPDWTSLVPAPPFPEYSSAHATGCAAAFQVMAATFGNETRFENTSLFAPPGMPTRTFPTFGAAAEECADSRVQLGWHFRYATRAGLAAGRRIARHVMETTLRPR